MKNSFSWKKPLASEYFRYAGGYLGMRFVFISLFGLVIQYLLTHYLGREDYGLLVWVAMVIAFLSPLGLPGMSTSITGAAAKGFHGNFRRGTLLEIAGGTVGGLVLLTIAAYYWIFGYSTTKAVVFMIAGVFGPGLWVDTHLFYWNGRKDFKSIFWWSVPMRFAQLVATAAILFYTSNPVWIFGGQTLVLVFANFLAIYKIIKIDRTNFDISRDYMNYGWLSSFLYLLVTVTAQIDKFIVGFFFGLDKLAIFAVGELIYNYFYKTPKTIISQIFMPRLAEISLKNASIWIKKRQLYLILSVAGGVVIIGMFLPIIYRFLFSSKYDDSIYYAYLFLVNILVGIPVVLVGTMMRAHGMKRETAISQAIISIPTFVLMPVLAYFMGIQGVIFSRIIQNIVLSGYCLFVLERCSK